ncbi:hypothetical protein GW879_02170, partial [Candidatus Kaiserbacteria bacterium]|nr:hypothetical protein [Candidatus Kaiserbacteria bacterium]
VLGTVEVEVEVVVVVVVEVEVEVTSPTLLISLFVKLLPLDGVLGVTVFT